DNVVNTSCPTLWDLNPQRCKEIPVSKANEVVTTLTFYHKNSQHDKTMLRILSENYDKVHLWIQGINDFHYYNEIQENFQNIEFVPPTIEAYNALLEKGNIDY